MACFRQFNKTSGFSVIEILAVLAIFALLLVSSMLTLGVLRGGSDVQADARALSRVLELARNKTISSEGDARYGVYATSTSPHRYILFRGDDYASRVVAEDVVYELRDTVEFVDPANFTGLSGQEVVFDRIQGSTSNAGYAVLQEKTNPANTRTVYVESSGNVEIDTSAVPSDNDRIKDSRHVHVTYTGRQIDTAVEEIELDFENNGTTDTTIVIADNLSGGQIVWEDTIDVGGEDQTIKIHTHKLNDIGFETEFSIHRDRRPNMNTKSLTIKVPGTVSNPDSGTLIQYDASGVITPGTSAYVTAASTTPQ